MSATKFKTQAIEDNAITTPKIADAQITQPKLASGVGGNTDHSFRIRRSTVQSIANATFTPIAWDIDQFDTDDLHSLSVNTDRVTITVPTAGKWLLSACIFFPGNASGQRIIEIDKNAGAISAIVQAPPGANNHGMNVSVIIDLSAGDFVRVQVYQDSGGVLNVGNTPVGEIWFSGIRIAS